MPRIVKSWEPETRRYIAENLFCPVCGNTTAFGLDMRLKYNVTSHPQGLEIGLSKDRTDKLTKALAKNLWKILDNGFEKEKPRIICANCGEKDQVDMHERYVQLCWESGCPGCWWCGEYIQESEVLENCQSCIVSRHGTVDEDDCYNTCEVYETGLEQVRAHYGLTLDGIKRDLGY